MAILTVGWAEDGGAAKTFPTAASAISAASDDDEIELYSASNRQTCAYFYEFLNVTKRLSFTGKLANCRKSIIGTMAYSNLALTSDITVTDIYSKNNISVTTQAGSTATITIERCTSDARFVFNFSNGGIAKVKACFILGSSENAFTSGGNLNTVYCYNCTAIDARVRSFYFINIFNCIGVGADDRDVSGCTGDYNLLGDVGGHTPGPNTVTGLSKDQTGLDKYNRMALGSTYIDSGFAYADAPSVDYWGNTYGSPPSIGADAGAIVSLDGDTTLDSQQGGNWTDVAEGNVADGIQWGVGGTSRTGSFDTGGIYDVVHWEYDTNDDLQPLEDPLDLNYPTEPQVELGVIFGAVDQYTGTLSGGGPRPTTPTVRVINNMDDTATATISGSDTGTTNTVWIFLRHGGVLELINAGSRLDDGDVEITNPEGEYIGFVVSELNNVLSEPSNPDGFWVTQDRQYLIRQSAAEAELQTLRLLQHSVTVEFQNGDTATPVSLLASMTGGNERLQLRDSVRTNTEMIEFYIPRQTGFPPEEFRPGATITAFDRVYEIDDIVGDAAALEYSATFKAICGNYRWLNRV